MGHVAQKKQKQPEPFVVLLEQAHGTHFCFLLMSCSLDTSMPKVSYKYSNTLVLRHLLIS